VLAVVFTVCQGVEYTVSSFTLSDGSFGSCFYFGTGLTVAPIIFNQKKNNTTLNKDDISY
jgi:heme/copper-type cytochrome/quinol oxidase subunit 3